MNTNTNRSRRPFDPADSTVRAERVRRGWSVVQLATASGLSPASVTLAERGYLPRGVVAKLSAALGVPESLLVPPQDGGDP
jgi:transcriptional regulator with XRE-family HTH domain